MASLFIDDIELEASGESPPIRNASPTYDDDLTWIVDMFVQRVGADGAILTRHPGDGRTIRMVAVGSIAKSVTNRLEHSAAIVAAANRRRARQSTPLIVWSGGDLNGSRAISLPIAVTATEQVVITAVYEADGFSEIEPAESMATRLHPVLDRYFRLWSRHRAECRRVTEYEAAFNLNGVATAMLDGSGRICQMNAAMRRLTAKGDGLRRHEHDGALVATDLASAVRLQVTIRHALAAAVGSADTTEALTLVCRRPNTAHGLVVSVSAVCRNAAEAGEAIVVVHALAPDADLGKSVRPICALHGLSPAETSLVSYMVNGHAIDAVAQMMRIKPDTARSYLKQIFVKTATTRQVDLVRLMIGSLLRLEPPTVATIRSPLSNDY